MPVYSHVDVRVRERERAERFYSAVLADLGLVLESRGKTWTSFVHAGSPAGEWFAFTEDATMTPGSTRIAFAAASRDQVDRVARTLVDIGAPAIDGPGEAYGPNYYAVFFEDPDGNKLEVCYVTAS
jgi:catechol 2,3-dioxygenase-like lactoylglutathione lyase family enzyme